MTDGILSAIHIHPVKGCRRVEADTAVVTAAGLAGDRVWQVVDAEGACVTQRTEPLLATVDTALDGDDVIVSAEGSGSATLSRAGGGSATATSLIGVPVEVTDAGDEAAEWVSTLLGAPHRFVAAPEAGYTPPSKIDQFGQTITFVDLSPVLVANTASLDWLVKRANEPFGMERFRANLIVETDAPWAEDTWETGSLGEAALEFGLPWPRCAVPQIDQLSGERRKEPAVVLKAHRWCDSTPLEGTLKRVVEGNALFGVSAGITPVDAEIRVGNPLVVSATKEPLLPAPA